MWWNLFVWRGIYFCKLKANSYKQHNSSQQRMPVLSARCLKARFIRKHLLVRYLTVAKVWHENCALWLAVTGRCLAVIGCRDFIMRPWWECELAFNPLRKKKILFCLMLYIKSFSRGEVRPEEARATLRAGVMMTQLNVMMTRSPVIHDAHSLIIHQWGFFYLKF